METNIRELKAHLSEYIRRVEDGEIITVSIRNRPVSRIVPIIAGADIERLMEQAGIAWSGGKPAGLPKGETLPQGISLSDWVIESRR